MPPPPPGSRSRCPRRAGCLMRCCPSSASSSVSIRPGWRSPNGSGSYAPRWNVSGNRSTSSRRARVQQQAALEQSRLARRLKELADKAGRGGDVAGLLGPLEIDAATFERDLIVNGARRRDAAALVQRAGEQRADLEAREAALRGIVEECVRRVDPAPRYAVPDTAALGPVPNTRDELEDYLRRLDQVSRAMTIAQTAYAKALHDHDELGSRLEAYRAKAIAKGVAEVPTCARAYELARSVWMSGPAGWCLPSSSSLSTRPICKPPRRRTRRIQPRPRSEQA